MPSEQGVHPVRLTIVDDLRRDRATVLFGALFTLPHMVWLVLWSVAAFVVAVLNWFATLVRGQSPAPFHNFLARYVRCATHAFAYLNLAPGPFPGFVGSPGYPVNVEIEPPARQSRWVVAFRIVLAVPAMLLVTLLAGFGANVYGVLFPQLSSAGFTLLSLAAFLGSFSALVRGRMPRGLRDLAAYGLSYGAQYWAYLLALTDHYPDSDPRTAIGRLPTRFDPVSLGVEGELRRSRLTVFFRLLLAVPHLIWLTLWGVVAVGAVIINWFATLIRGVPPQSLHHILTAYLRYQTHVAAYLYLIGNPFPGFTGKEGSYPVDLHFAKPVPQNRWSVLFRAVLAVPALPIAGTYNWLLFFVAFLGWFAALVTGRIPNGLRNAGALVLGYVAHTNAYLYIITGVYPDSGPADSRSVPDVSSPPPAPDPELPVLTPTAAV